MQEIPITDDRFEDLLRLARAERDANRLDTALLLGPDRTIYPPPEGGEHEERSRAAVPRSSWLAEGLLQPPPGGPRTKELTTRELDLRWFALGCRPPNNTMIQGDLTKGGRIPPSLERRTLLGRGPEGVPQGLERCSRCSRFRGQCIDPNPVSRSLLVTVHCLCENHNRCARCRVPFHRTRLNGIRYDEEDGRVCHVPAFTALVHRCHDLAEPNQPQALEATTGRE